VVGSFYGVYAAWRGVPHVEVVVVPSVYGGEMREYLLPIFEEHASGWVVLDWRFHGEDLPHDEFQMGGKTITFVGNLKDQMVWSWGVDR
jgi:hypothetical protein